MLKMSLLEWPGGPGVKDPVWSLLRPRFDSWPGNFRRLQMRIKKIELFFIVLFG